MQPGFRAGSILGDMIFGQPDGKVYAEQTERNLRSAKLMEEARKARSINLARETLTPDMVRGGLGSSPEQAALFHALLGAQDNPNLNVLGATPLQMQEYTQRRAAVEALTPVLGAGNANLAGVAGKPLEVNTIDGGYQLNPYDAGGAAVPTLGETTDAGLTRARIATQGALGSKYDAQADAGGFAPRSPGKGTPVATRAGTLEEDISVIEGELGRALTKPERTEYLLTGKFRVFDKAGKPLVAEAPATALGAAPQGVDPGEYAKATQLKADALAAIKKGAPKEKVSARLREKGYPKLAEWVMGAR